MRKLYIAIASILLGFTTGLCGDGAVDGWHVGRVPLGVGDVVRGIHFADSRVGFVWAKQGLFRSEDGGQHWGKVGRPAMGDGEIARAWFSNRRHGWVAGRAGDAAGIWETIDGGHSWTLRMLHESAGEYPSYALDVAFSSKSVGWAVGSDNREAVVWGTMDGGRSWSVKWKAGLGSELQRVLVDGPAHLWVAGLAEVFELQHQSQRWQSVKPNALVVGVGLGSGGGSARPLWIAGGWGELQQAGGQPAILPVAMRESFLAFVGFGSGIGWAVSADGRVAATEDGGRSWLSRKVPEAVWVQLDNPERQIAGLSATGRNCYMVNASGGVLIGTQ
jgi:hypothetical protein